MSHVAGVVLTGGASRRMGVDKAFVAVDGRPMAIAVADALWEAGCHPVECQGGDLAALASLGLTGVADDDPHAGPVAAIRSASRRHGAPIVVAACDLPQLDAATVTAVLDAGRAADRAAVAVTGDRHHLVVYVPTGMLDDEPTDRSLREAFADAVTVQVDAVAVRNVNTTDDLTEGDRSGGDVDR
ncbi:MAG: NTP transferase domain-containing protein [Ilumatobacter sp.]|nr:NTP transferase domain-containing protein [Ilumatobacter sp.]